MAEVTRHLMNSVLDRVMKDLQPSLTTIYFKSGVAVLIGGFLSLFVCGQFGVAVTSSALHLNKHLHHNTEGLACVLLCGTIFSIAPAIVLRLLCSPLQFRAITRRSFHAPFVWLTSIGGFLAYHGEHGRELISFLFWCAAAVIMFEVSSRIIEFVMSRWERLQLQGLE